MNRIRQEREDEAGDERRADVPGQRADQHEHADARQREPGEQQQVVDDELRHAEPDQRRDRERRHQHRIGERQRVACRVEDVGVEQMQRIAAIWCATHDSRQVDSSGSPMSGLTPVARYRTCG